MPALGLVQYANAFKTGAGSVELVAAPGAGFKIVVIGLALSQSDGTVLPQLDSAAAAKWGPHQGTIPFSVFGSKEAPIMECNENEALNLTVAALTGRVSVTYKIVTEKVSS